MRVSIYVEGGGDDDALITECRRAFSTFFSNASFKGRMPRIIACGGRNQAFDRFQTAIGNAGKDDFPMLLVDSEAPLTKGPWLHLKDRDQWTKPANATADHVHLMVQCMEAWFLVDRDILRNYFGDGFVARQLPANSAIEQIEKQQVFHSLKMATRRSQKGEYAKGRHSFKLLELQVAANVATASPQAARLLSVLGKKLK